MLRRIETLINKDKLLLWMELHSIPDSSLMIVTSLLVGLTAGFGAVGFRKLIEVIQKLSFQDFASFLNGIGPYHLVIIPAIGGAVIGPIIYKFAREAKGHGVPEVMEAVALRGGRIRPQVVFVKAISSAICIGTGGSVGREGPIAQIGSAIGSTLGQVFRLSEDRIRTLVACGAAGGISATFNAPIGGALFAMEVILGKLQVTNFVSVVISAVIADVIGQTFEGNVRAFNIPAYTMGNPSELFLYALLGILAAIFAVAFTRFLYLSEDLWDKVPLPEYLKPMIGGALLGILGLLTFKLNGIPRIFGVGYETITDALTNSLSFQVVVLLLFLKILATSLTIGSGGSGGIFAPSLYMGAMLGLGFGNIIKAVFPEIPASPGAFSLVGMAAFFTGAAHAPITSILILFEMTNDYKIILPLMFATVVSTLVSRIISKESIYTLKLTRRGIHLDQGQDIDVMQGITVSEVMDSNIQPVSPEMSLEKLSNLFSKTHHHGFPVIDENERLIGVVTASDLDRQMLIGNLPGKTVSDICTKSNLLVALPNEPVWKPLKTMSALDIGIVPVIKDPESRNLVGVVRRSNIIRAYNHAIAKRAHLQHKNEMYRLGKLDNTIVEQTEISDNSPYIGMPIKDLPLPSECLIISIRRRNRKKLLIAHGHTTLQAGDRITMIAEKICLTDIVGILNADHQGSNALQADIMKQQEFLVTAGAPACAKSIADLHLPGQVIVVNIQRKNEILIPHGNTVLQPGDVIEIFGKDQELNLVASLFSAET